MRIVNLTPHPVKIFPLDEIAPEQTPARLEETIEAAGFVTISDRVKIPIIKKVLGKITNLPESIEDTIFVVSLPVAQAAKRTDVFAIGETVRDTKGFVVGAKSLATFV